MMSKFNKNQLDLLATILGAIAGIFTVLGTQQVISPKVAGTVSGIATVLLGIIVQRPADKRPTTEEVEEKEISE